MPHQLYIIGNGFDLHHGLDTRYQTFGKLIKNHQDTYEWLTRYFSFSDPDSSESNEWNDFENRLVEFDSEQALSDFTDCIPNIGDDDYNTNIGAFEIEMSKLRDQFFHS